MENNYNNVQLTYTQQIAVQIQIKVSNPVSKKELIGKTIIYTVEGQDERGSFNVQRKYFDFYAMRDILVQRWPGCYIPMAPERKLFDTDSKFVQKRIIELNNFLYKLTKFPHLYQFIQFFSQYFWGLAHRKSADIDKELRNFPKQLNEELFEKYQKNFFEIVKQPVTIEIQGKITNFNIRLEKIQGMLKNFKDMAGAAAKSRKNFNEKFYAFIAQCLPEYEKTCLAEYYGNKEPLFVLENNDQKFSDIKTQLKELNIVSNAYDEFADFINNELDDIRAFQDSIIGQKKNYEQQKEKAIKDQQDKQVELQKLKSGKKTISTLFGNKDDKMTKLELQIEQLKSTIEVLQNLCAAITSLIGFQEIDQFNASKKDVYYSAIKKVALLEQNNNKIMTELWEYLGANTNVQNAEDMD